MTIYDIYGSRAMKKKSFGHGDQPQSSWEKKKRELQIPN